ncbi:MAG: methyltransferase domain-containing protein [Methanomicrobiales archaeon]|nr:methyltransferase domain-containing protein [Methanomicrobiales archaeon]
MKDPYVHGYSSRESVRLQDQAQTLEEILHHDTRYPPHCRVLEIGCGVGAQTVILGRSSPRADITSVDISEGSIRTAREKVRNAGMENIRFLCGDIYRLPFTPESADHIFVCFVLEHLRKPGRALRELRRVMKTGGSLTVIEGDHGSALFHPENRQAQEAIRCLVTLQEEQGGNACIGRELYPLVTDAGFREVLVSPRMIYADANRPDLQEGFTRCTFTAMIEGVEKEVLARGMMGEAGWREGIAALYRTSGPRGTFCYTFFKATAVK